MKKKIPKSVLVIVHDKNLNVLLLERADHKGYWQSITGSIDFEEEDLFVAAKRELKEETGLEIGVENWLNWNFSQNFKIFQHWRHRYEEGVEFNTEHVFSVCAESSSDIILSPREHVGYDWMFWREAAENCFSWTNVQAINELPKRLRKFS